MQNKGNLLPHLRIFAPPQRFYGLFYVSGNELLTVTSFLCNLLQNISGLQLN